MTRIEREKATVSAMIKYYCRKHHAVKNICHNCSELNDYAIIRLEKCKFGDEKPSCKSCPVHCYAMDKREKIKEVMIFSGPGMLLRHPILAFFHLAIDSK